MVLFRTWAVLMDKGVNHLKSMGYKRHAVLMLGVLSAVVALPGTAQNYPAKPVRMIIPFSAGGAADVPGRIITQIGEGTNCAGQSEARPD